MSDILRTIDPALLVLLVIFLGGYFIWSVKTGIKDIKELIKELFDDRNSHENRIVRLETRCFGYHGPPDRRTDELFQQKDKSI